MSRAIDRLRQIAAAWHRATSVDSSMLPVHICFLVASPAAADAQRARADDAAHSAEHWQESHDLELARADAAEAECVRLTTERDAARAEAAGLRAALATATDARESAGRVLYEHVRAKCAGIPSIDPEAQPWEPWEALPERKREAWRIEAATREPGAWGLP